MASFMSRIYCDTSYVISLYAPDIHSTLASKAAGRGRTLILSSLTELELINALELRIFRRELPNSAVQHAMRAFQGDLAQEVYGLQPISPAVFERAKQLSKQHSPNLGTRSLDILHVAAALECKATTIYSFDVTQKKLARAAGLSSGPA